jgi:S1-C subfamily serine protease
LRTESLFFFVFLVVFAIPHAQAQTLSLTPPKRPPWENFYILGNQTAYVWVNVTSSVPIDNVTLYYVTLSKDCCPPEGAGAIDLYESVRMYQWFVNDSFFSYEVQMPRVANNSFVFGFARAYPKTGNYVESGKSDGALYYYTIPNPKSSFLRLQFNVRHINPRSLSLNLTASAWLQNAVTYLPEVLQGRYQWVILSVSTPYQPYTYGSGESNFELYPSGQPQLFPFDSYTYWFDLFVPTYLNSTGIVIESMYGDFPLNPKSPVKEGLIGLSARSQGEAVDNSLWDVQSTTQYFSSGNFTAQPPYLRVIVTLHRNWELVDLLLLLPTFSLYALLGLSVLLRGKDQLQNRLLLYITIFGFSYTLQPTVKTIAPIMFGFSMMDRIVIALIPCTVVLSACSIIPIWRRRDQQDTTSLRWDATGVLGAVIALLGITVLRINDYPSNSLRMFTLLDTGLYGWLTLGALVCGLLLILPREPHNLLGRVKRMAMRRPISVEEREEKTPMQISEAIDHIRPAVVQIRFFAAGFTDEVRRRMGRPFITACLGTGFFVNSDGYVVTACHVIQQGRRIAEQVQAGNKQIGAGLAQPNTENMRGNFALVEFDEIDADEQHDLALLKLKRNPFKGEVTSGFAVGGKEVPLLFDTVTISPKRPKDGTAVGISGYPLDTNVLVTNNGFMATSWESEIQELPVPGIPQTFSLPQIADVYLADVEVNPGNSGAPVYSIEDGAVIGVCRGSKLAPVRDQAGEVVSIVGQNLFYSSGLTIVVPARYVIDLLKKNGLSWSEVSMGHDVS